MAHEPATDNRTLTFDVGGESLGMAASLVNEVVLMPRLARVPHAPDALMGVAQIRGIIVPVLSVASLLGREQPSLTRVIVTDLDGPVGLAVTTVSQVIDGADASAVMRLDLAKLVATAVPERRARRSGTAVAGRSVQVAEKSSDTVALIAFGVGGQDFALPFTAVEKVLRLPTNIVRMPHADSAALGSVAVRGTVLPLLSLAALLALPVGEATARSRVIVVRIGAHRVGLVVDAMRSIERVPETDVDAVPQVLNRGGGEARIQAICRLENGARLLSVLAPDHLVNEDITARLLQGETGEATRMKQGTEDRSERFLLFRIGDEHFGMPVDAVLEVTLLPQRLTPLPKAPAFVLGVMNIRGQVIPVIDQAQRFNGVPSAGAKPRVMVVRIGELIAGFIVDGVSQVVQVPTDALREAPDLGGEGTRVFDRVATLDDHDALVLIVSPQELLDRAERDVLLALGRKAAKNPS